MYELPCQFPVLKEGIHKVSFKPGIKVNGISATRAIYPFYKSITLDTFLLKDDIIYFDTLTTKYSTIAKFPWKEDFEDSGISLEPTFHSDTTINKISNDPGRVFEGTYSGKIILTDSIQFINIKTSEAWPLPTSNAPVFLELNYKTNNPFHVGIYSNTISESIQHDLLIITESDNWNKIYVNLTEVVSREFNAIDYNIWFGAVKNEDVDTAEILLDNIKLIHF